MLSVGTERQKERTAQHILSEYVGRSGRGNRIYVVHRLDRDTSGLMMFAKDEKTQYTLRDHWHDIVTDRRYVAVVTGEIEKDSDTVVSWLTDRTSAQAAMMMAVPNRSPTIAPSNVPMATRW